MPILPALTVLFVGLKLTGLISWSWLWVLAPLWLGVPACIVIWLAFVVFLGWVYS